VASLASVLSTPRYLVGLAGFLNGPLTLEQSRALIRHRMETREARFLRFVRRFVYGHPSSPYLALLRHAGCEYGDVEGMVRQRGLGPTLETLRNEGVYLTFREFKGLRDVVRGSKTFRFRDVEFDNPFRGASMEIRSGATRSAGSPVTVTLDFIAEAIAPAFHVTLSATQSQGPIILWLAGFPSGAGVSHWLALAKMRRPPARWFSMTDPYGSLIAGRHRLMWMAAAAMSRLWRAGLPAPEFTPVSSPEPVLQAMLALRRAHGGCTLMTSPSAAVRLAALAQRQGTSLEGIPILAAMEPLTPGKAAEIRRSGATVFSTYGLSETGIIAGPCGNPDAPDDMHLLSDCFAMILRRRTVAGIGELDAYMLTTLLDSPRKVMLNAEIDDFGDFVHRRCGCPYDEVGLRFHLSRVRSFTKLTGEGTMVLGHECTPILEEILPREFGGRSIDYQLLEEEDEHRLTRLFLVVSPEVGAVDEERVAARFTEELQRVQPRGIRLWLQDGTIRVVRREPVRTPRGKLLPFHTQALALLGDRPEAGRPPSPSNAHDADGESDAKTP
jgi:hypothetical protein